MSHPDGLGSSGLSIRLLDPATGEWSIYWVNSRTGKLVQPPVVGGFSDGVGMFYDQEQYEGRDITVRFKWSDIGATTARWEQAFSVDNGRTWETNWTAVFARIA